MIEAHLDIAAGKWTEDRSQVEIGGWAFAERGHIVVVQVFGNGVPLGFIPYGFSRVDVSEFFGSRCPSAQVGFHGLLRLPDSVAKAKATPLEVKVVFTSSELEKRELAATVSLPVGDTGTKPPAPPAPEPGIKESADTGTPPPGTSFPKLAAPNFFILGAAKCGTTSLYYALKQHPEIHLSAVKEPSFFSTGFQVVRNPIEYCNLFPEQAGKKRYGEASHVYFSSPETAPVLRQLFPDAKFLLIVRNPVHRAHSLYQHMRRAGDEFLPTFELALAEEDHRFADPGFRARCPQYFWNYMYCRTSMYDVQLCNYLEHFPREQFLVLTLGEWRSDPVRWQAEIFRFLEVDPSVQVSTEPQNQAAAPSTLREETRSVLENHFTGMRERLEGLVGRRLEHWEV
ncbi:sulfotransferase domain-containing protein [Roseimicrobium sp. ORNL1]|uniref:sulfotransferase family protein n=1 Tax=Roseimicrobium sp. ORNL1 TaxID=2711231 RepID=UPI0013E1FC40|nr:sulfotransferase domain-containing protein [Roseimicrobium sp. ORNL1]QIF05176.1 sulfotransferase domain-containing protein [Roseimicrobium sp. ORNL1]